MPIRTRLAGFDGRHRIIIAGRVLGGLFLTGLYLFGVRGRVRTDELVVWATGLWIVWTFVMSALALRLRPSAFPRLMTVSVIVDSVVFGMLTVALTEQHHDPFYVWYLAEVVMVVLLVRTRGAWTLGWVLGASYVISTLLVEPMNAQWLLYLSVNVAVFVLIAYVVAIAVSEHDEHNERLLEQRREAIELNFRLQRSISELRAVTEITELIHSTFDIETVGPRLLDILQRVVSIPAAALYVIDTAKQETVFSASRGITGSAPRTYVGVDLATTSVIDQDDALSCLELLEHGNALVVFCAQGAVIEALSRDDRIVLQTVASELIVAVENARLYRLTKRLAVTDELTDLYNYRYLQQRLDDEISRAERYGKRLSLLMLDIDDFKQVNDTYGHMVGDGVLAALAQVLKGVVREVDIVARYGGEEFSIVLPETDASGAFIVAEKVREAVSMQRFADANGEQRIHLTVSVGLASYPVHAHDKEAVLRAADNALYQAKEMGKNRVRAPRLRLQRVPVEPTPVKEAAE